VAQFQYNLPTFLYGRLLQDIAATMNMIPTYRSKPLCPFYIATGKKISRRHDLKAPFGSVVVVKNNTAKNAAEGGKSVSKGVLGIVVGRDSDSRGAVIVYLIDQKVFVARAHIQIINPTQDVIGRINRVAQATEMEPSQEIISNSNGPIVEEHAPFEEPLAIPSQLRANAPDFLPTISPDPTGNVTSAESKECRDSEIPLEEVPITVNGEGRRSNRTRRFNWRTRHGELAAFHISVKRAEERFPGKGIEAAAVEMNQLIERKTIVPVAYAPKSEKIIHSQLFMNPKYDLEGNLKKVKGRLVASGNEVDRSMYDSSSTAAPTIKFEGLMILLAASSHENGIMGTIDFPGAFLNARLEIPKYMFLG